MSSSLEGPSGPPRLARGRAAVVDGLRRVTFWVAPPLRRRADEHARYHFERLAETAKRLGGADQDHPARTVVKSTLPPQH